MHEPNWDNAEQTPLCFVYAVAKLKNGGLQFDVISKAAVKSIHLRSNATNSGPWKTDCEEMAHKIIIRRQVSACKR